MEGRSQHEIDLLRESRGGAWPAIRWIHRHRPILTNLLVIAAPVHVLLDGDRPVDLLDPAPSPLFGRMKTRSSRRRVRPSTW